MNGFSKTSVGVLALSILTTNLLAADSPVLVADPAIRVPDSKGGFDFLKIDEAQDRLLANHTGNNTLDVFNLNDGKLVKHIATGKAQDVAVDAADGKYFVSVSVEQKVVVIDSTLLDVAAEIKLDGPADAIALDAKNHRLYVGHDDEKDLWVLDTHSNHKVADIPIPAGPEVILYDSASDRFFQNIKTNDTVLVIDPKTNTVSGTWSTAPAKAPHGLAYNPETHHLFSAGTNGKLVVIDATNGKSIGSADIAKGVDQIVFDAPSHRVYCACGSGKISVLEDSGAGVKSLGEVASAPGAKTLACDPKTHAVWIAYADKEGPCIQRFRPQP